MGRKNTLNNHGKSKDHRTKSKVRSCRERRRNISRTDLQGGGKMEFE